MNFIPLHVETCYSFFRSSLRIEDFVNEAKNRNLSFLGISDLNEVYAYPLFNNLCLKNNIAPLFGIKLFIEEIPFVLYVKNENGYLNLIKIINKYHKEKRLTFADNNFKDIIGIIPTSSFFFDDNIKNIINKLFKIKNYFENFYIGLEIYEDENINHINLLREHLKNNNFKIIAFPLVKHLTKNEAGTLKILEAIEENKTLERNFDIPSSRHFYSLEEILNFYNSDEINGIDELVHSINFTFIKKRGSLLNYAKFINSTKTSRELLIEKIYEGLDRLSIDLNKNELYKKRLNYEFSIISKMGYEDYFLIVQDYVNYAKNNNILVGPGRGSAAGSLIAYILNITECNPLKYDLLFERFLNPKRTTMPDIDIDFEDNKRELVVKYLEDKYGFNCVSRVITFQKIKIRQAIRDSARVFGYPVKVADSLINKIPASLEKVNSNCTLEDCYKEEAFKNAVDNSIDYKFIFETAKLIENLPRQKGQHAAGIILTDDILSLMPVDYINDDEIVSSFEKDYLENQGFLKFDLLALSNLRVISNCLALVKYNKNIVLNFKDISIDDPIIYEILKKGMLMGLFQIDASAGKIAILDIKPDNFKEIVDAISLARPGPIEYIKNYVLRKNGKEKIIYPSKDLIPVLSSTYGIIIYQEQIMQICRIYCGFNYSDADLFRRAISKKDEKSLNEMKEKFIKGAINKNHNKNEALKIFDIILKFANYGFNKSHAVTYAMITAKMAYLKAKFPSEFYSSILTNQVTSSDAKLLNYINEIKNTNIKLKLPDINTSLSYFYPNGNNIIIPFTKIKGISLNLSDKIVKERNKNGLFDSLDNFIIRMNAYEDNVNLNTASLLIDAGCFDSLVNNRKALKQEVQFALTKKFLFDTYEDLKEEKFNSVDISKIDDKKERILNEFNALGFLLSDSILNYIDIKDKDKITPIKLLKNNYKCTIVGFATNVSVINVKKGKYAKKAMAFVDLKDETDNIELTIFPETYQKYIDIIKKESVLLVYGKKEISKTKTSFIADEIEEIKIDE